MERTVEISQRDWTELVSSAKSNAEKLARIADAFDKHVEEHKTIAHNCTIHETVINKLEKDMYSSDGQVSGIWKKISENEARFFKIWLTLSVLMITALGTMVWFMITDYSTAKKIWENEKRIEYRK